MDRRTFLGGLTLGALVAPRGARAQAAGTAPARAAVVETAKRADPDSTSTNVALASAGAIASASSVYAYTPGYGVEALNDGVRTGAVVSKAGRHNPIVWMSEPDASPDPWAQINFPTVKSIHSVVVYSQQTLFLAPIEPYSDMTSLRCMAAFAVQTWNGSAWVTQKTVAANTLVRKVVTFDDPVPTARVRVVFARVPYGRAVIAEIEAWTGAPPSAPATPPPAPDCFSIGATRYQTLASALGALTDGQTLDIKPGHYREDCGASSASNITIRCVGGKAFFYKTFGGKSVLNLDGNNVLVQGICGIGCTNGDSNGGLIRFNGDTITIDDMEADLCEMPYLSGLSNPNGIETLNRPRIRRTEGRSPQGGIGHGLYFGKCAEGRIVAPDIDGTMSGHLVKSRAAKLVVDGGRLVEGPRTSRAIDACLGGVVELKGHLYIEQGLQTDNYDIIGYGAECPSSGGIRTPAYPVNTIDIAPDVRVVDKRVPPTGSVVNLYIQPSALRNRGTYNRA